MRTKLRRIADGSVLEKTFRAGEKFRPVRTESRKMQYLYDSGDTAVFMDSRDYEQIEVPREIAGAAMQWVLPNAEVDVLFVDDRPSEVQVASAIDMKVAATEPGVKGDTASGGGTKQATLESGVTVQVPFSSRREKAFGLIPATVSISHAPERYRVCKSARIELDAKDRPTTRCRFCLLPARRNWQAS